MALLDWLTGGGKSDAQKGYDQSTGYYRDANGNLAPYQQMGQQASGDLSGRAAAKQAMMAQYGNPADWQWRNAGLSPEQRYQNIMGSYTESPQAKYNQEIAMRAANQGASASGMLGSGAFQKAIQENANQISQRDQQQYFDDVMGTNMAQMGAINNFQGQDARIDEVLRYLTSLGFDASQLASQNAMTQGGRSIQNGMNQANLDQQGMEELGGLIGGIGQFAFNKFPLPKTG